MREVTTHPLLTGQCRHPEVMTVRGGRLRPIGFPAVAMLIIHPSEGPILFDTGYDQAFLQATEPFPERLYRWTTPVVLKQGQDAASQCRAIGFVPEDIRHLVLSHFHADHMAGTYAFPNAKIYCARRGFEAACEGGRVRATRRGILRRLFPADFSIRAAFFEDGLKIALPKDCLPFEYGVDILGDASLVAIELPGHCAGHWGLLLNDAKYGRHFLVADAAWSLKAIEHNAPPPALTTYFLGDTAAVRKTLLQLHQLSRRNPEIRMTPCHCAQRATEIEAP